MNKLKKLVSMALSISILAISIIIPVNAEGNGQTTLPSLKIIYTNDVHGGFNDDLGYKTISAIKTEETEKGNQVLLIDAGDAVQGSIYTALSNGESAISIMNELKYDIAIPGNHEFDYGINQFKKLTMDLPDYPYICSNFIDLNTHKSVFAPYIIKQYNQHKIAFVGIVTPKTYTSTTPAYFQDEYGKYIYSFCEGDNGNQLYNNVQNAINKAKTDGADIIIGIAHLGDDESCTPWMSTNVIANTTGFNAVVDGHSHSTVAGNEVKDKDGNNVIVTQTGTKLKNIGEMTITNDGNISTELISKYDITTKDESVKAAYQKTEAFVDNITNKIDDETKKVIATTDFDLVTDNPETNTRMVRNCETNLGDLCADACKTILGSDIGIENGGGIREQIAAGNISFKDLINVNPFGNMVSVIEVTGQQIADALEWSVSNAPNEFGGFLHVSGLTFDYCTNIPSTVKKDDYGSFISVEGERRVSNIKVGNDALDLNKTYTLAGIDYILKNGGNGYSMFKNSKVIKDADYLDNQVLLKYITENLNGNIPDDYKNPFGQNRINIKNVSDNNNTGNIDKVTEPPVNVIDEDSNKQTSPATGENNTGLLIAIIFLSSSLTVLIKTKKVKLNK